MKNLAKAVLSVMKEVKGMEKNSSVGTGNNTYQGTKDQDVKEVFNNALSKNGLCILPISLEDDVTVSRWEEEGAYKGNSYKKQKQSVFTKVKTKYMLLHETGESIELVGYGHGVDSQDKSAGKATTYALKNCLLYTFLTPVGKIDDSETEHSDEIEVPKNKSKSNNQNNIMLLTDENIKSSIAKGKQEELLASISQNKFKATEKQIETLQESIK